MSTQPISPGGDALARRFLDVCRRAYRMLACFGLHDWHFAYNRRKQSMGFCRYASKTIELSCYLVVQNGPEEVEDTILHEIAHALVGPGHGHNTVWKRKCIEIGARPVRCGQADMPVGRWRALCRGCGKLYHRYRRPKQPRGWFCRLCGRLRGALIWQDARS
jgi:predicted SprT family Zn-dependent metalloprotease